MVATEMTFIGGLFTDLSWESELWVFFVLRDRKLRVSLWQTL